MFKKILISIFACFLFFISFKSVLAFKATTFVSIINPVRGSQNWNIKNQSPLDLPQLLYQESTPSALPQSWALRLDAVNDATISGYFSQLIEKDKNQSLAAYLEFVPLEANLMQIDTYMSAFWNKFGFYPSIVLAQYLDSSSLSYLHDHYSVIAAIIADNSGYLNAPYYPTRLNTLIPASNIDNKINLVVTHWPLADLDDKSLSLYSQKYFNEFTQINLGIENNASLSAIKPKIKLINKLLVNSQDKHTLRFIKLNEFSDWFMARYPETSPAYLYQLPDSLQYQNPFYRLTLKPNNSQTVLDDFYIFNPQVAEEAQSLISNFTDKPVFDFDFSQIKINFEYWDAIFTSNNRLLRLEPKKIIFSNFTPPQISNINIQVSHQSSQTVWNIVPTLPYVLRNSFFWFALIFILFLILLFFLKLPPSSIIVICLSASLILLTMVRSGQYYPFGLGFWGPNGHDALFHLSIINSLAHNLTSLKHPQLSGFFLQNYHLGFDYLAALINRFTLLPILDLYFRFLPLFFVFLISFLVFKLLKSWQFSSLAINLSLFLIFLTGSLGFLPSLLQGKGLFNGESFFWANQSVSILLNPPFALSLIFLLLFFYFYDKKCSLICLGLITGLLVQIKVYAFILLIISLFLNRQIRLFLISCFFGLLFILPTLKLGGSPFIFAPLWFVKSAISAQDRLNWANLAQAWQVYEINSVWLKLFLVSFLAFLIFIIGNLGIRIIGLLSLCHQKFVFSSQKLIIPIILLGLILPLLIIQQSNPWNTIQFFYYSLFFLSFFTALLLSKKHFLIIFALIFFLALPTTIGTLKDYVTRNSSSRISFTEIFALYSLSQKPRGIVISPIFNSQDAHNISSPKSLYAYTSTAYISSFTPHQEYLADTINLDITLLNYQDRTRQVERLFNTLDTVWARDFLCSNNINYIYETPLAKIKFNKEDAGLNNFFSSSEINLYQVNCYD